MEVHTHRQLTVLISSVSLLGVFVAFLTYVESKKNRETKAELLDIEKQLKEIQLYRAKQA